jgi:hypothetical protein
MKRRGWRVALTVATLGLALVGGLVALNWAAARDHAEAWWFQATRETRRIDPEATSLRDFLSARPQLFILTSWVFRCLASDSGLRVIFDAEEDLDYGYGRMHSWIPATAEATLAMLRQRGFRILEQRFPSPAYVVMGCPPAFEFPQRLRGEASVTITLKTSPQ